MRKILARDIRMQRNAQTKGFLKTIDQPTTYHRSPSNRPTDS